MYFNNSGSDTNVYMNYGAGNYFNNFILYSGGGALSVTGDKTFLNKLENNNSGDRLTFLAELSSREGDFEINPVGSGGILISNVVMKDSGKQLKVYGGNTLTVAGAISMGGSGNANSFAIMQGATVVFQGANTYSGASYIYNGTLSLNTGGSINNSSIELGGTTGSASAKVTIASGVDLGTTNSKNLVVVAGSSGSKTVESSATSGTATLSRNTYLNADLTTASASGGTLAITSGEFDLKNQTLTVSGAGNTIISGTLTDSTGSGNVAKTNAGILTISGNNTHSGATHLNEGTIRVGHNNALGTGGLTLRSGTFASDGGTARTITNLVTMAGDVTLGDGTGTGDLAFSNVNLSQATRTFTVGNNTTVTGVISNGGATAAGLTKNGAGTLALSGANTYSGTTTVNAGVLAVSGGSAIDNAGVVTLSNNSGATFAVNGSETIGSLRGGGASGGNVSVATNQTLTVAESGSQTYSGSISGSGGFTKSGDGTTTLSGNSSYSGATTISGGTLVYNGNNTSTAVGIGSGATLAGSGSVGATTVNSGGTMSPGSSPGTQTYSSLVWEGGGHYNWQLYDANGAAGTGYDTFVTSGALAINSSSNSPFNINLWTLSSISPSDVNGSAINFNSANNYTWTLGTFGSISGFSSDAFAINDFATNGTGGFANSFGAGTFSVSTNSTQLLLVYTAPASDYNVTVTTGADNQGAASGGSGQFTGTASVNKLGAGTLVMTNGANDYTGVTTVQAGTLQIDVNAPSGSAGALGNATSAVVVGDTAAAAAAGFNIGAENVTNSRNLTVVAGTGAADRVVGTTITSGTAEQAGNVTLNTNASLSAASGGTMVYSGALSGSGNITATNGGTSVLSGANTYTGTTTVANGATLVAANSSALGTTAGNTTVNSGGTLAVSNGITEDEALNVNGTGVGDGGAIRNLSGNNTLAGNVTLAGATRVNSDAGLLTMSGNVNGANNALTVGGTGNTTISGNITNSTAGLTKDGAGTATLSGANTYTGATTVSAGTLAISGGSAISDSSAVSVASGSTLQVGGTETIGSLAGAGGTVALGTNGIVVGGLNTATTYSGVLTGSGNFSKNGTGTQTLSGNSTGYSGEVILNNGTLRAGSDGALGTGTVTINYNDGSGTRTLAAADGNAYTLNNNFNLYYDTFTLGQTNDGTGSLTLGSSGKTFFLGSDNPLSTRSTTVLGSHTIAASVTGNNNFVKAGSGTLTLSGNNTFTGSTTVDAGTLALSGSGSLASSSRVNVGSGATLDVSGVTTSASVAILSEQAGGGDGGAVKLGTKNLTMTGGNATYYFNNLGVAGDTGSFTLNAANSTLSIYGASEYTGATTLSAGTLSVGAAMSSASYALNGGNLTTTSGANLANTAAVTLGSGSSTFTVGATDTIGSFGGTAGTVSILTNVTLTTGDSGNTTFSGVISGAGALVKNGAGTLTLNGTNANTYSGTTTVGAGVLVLAKTNVNALAGTPTINDGGTIRLGAGNQFSGDTTFLTVNSGGVFDMNGFNETLAIQGAGTVTLGGGTMTINPGNTNTGDTFSGVIAGATGSVIKTNVGIQTLSGNSTYDGATTVAQGILRVASANALGSTNGATTVNTGTALQLTNASSMTVAENITLNGTGVGGFDGALRNIGGSNTVSGNVTLASNARIGATGGSLNVSGNIGGGTNTLFVGGSGNSTISGVLSGSGNVYTTNVTQTSLFKDGASTLTLSGNNDYTGDTRITAGRVVVAAGGSLGNGSDVFVSDGAVLAVDTDTTIASVQERGTGNGGEVAIGSGATLTVNGANKGTLFQDTISGEGNLVVDASGTTSLSLYGTQSWTGTTTVSGGKLSTGVALASSGVTVDGGTFETTADNVLGNSVGVTLNSGTFSAGGSDTVGALSGSGGTLTLANGKTFTSSFDGTASTFAGTISGAGVFAKSGTGTLTLSGSNNYSGGTFLYGGTLDADNNYAFGTGSVAVYSNTTLDLLSHNITNQIINNGGTISSAGVLSDVDAEAGETTISGNGSTVTQAAGTATVTVAANDVVVSNVEGSAQVNIAGTGANVGTVSGGTVTLSNGATDAAISTASAGTVNANATGVHVGTISNAAVVNIRGNNGRVATLAGGTLNADAAGLVITNKTGGNLAVSNGVTVALRSGNSAGVISGAGGVAKQGATTLTLSGVNTYTGTTSVEQGRLVVANGGSLASTNTTVTGATLTVNGTISGAVTASSGGVVGGSGTVGTLNINGGGVFGPGNSAGTTTATNGATWSQGGSYAWEIFDLAGPSGTGWDLLDVTGGALDLTGITSSNGFTINLITLQSDNTTQGALSGFDPTATYTNWMIASAPTITGFLASEFNLNSSLFVGATGTFGIEQRSITGGEGLFVTYTAGSAPVPEPGTWAAAALLAGAAAYVRLRRRKEVEPKA